MLLNCWDWYLSDGVPLLVGAALLGGDGRTNFCGEEGSPAEEDGGPPAGEAEEEGKLPRGCSCPPEEEEEDILAEVCCVSSPGGWVMIRVRRFYFGGK